MNDPKDQTLEMAGGEILKFFSYGETKTQIVGQSELLPCLLAQRLWGSRMEGRAVMYFLDNEAAKYGLIKGSSPSKHSGLLIHRFLQQEQKGESLGWFERVPSTSNCADGPSRGHWGILKSKNERPKFVTVPEFWEEEVLRELQALDASE